MRKKAFSLVELLVVVAIIGILSTVVFVNYGGSQARSRDSKRRADIQQIAQALELYKSDKKIYPATVQPDGAGNCGPNSSFWWYCSIVIRGETTGSEQPSPATSTFRTAIQPYLTFPSAPKFNTSLAVNDQDNYWYLLFVPTMGDRYYLKAKLELPGIVGIDMPGETCAGATGGLGQWTDGAWSSQTDTFCVAHGACGNYSEVGSPVYPNPVTCVRNP